MGQALTRFWEALRGINTGWIALCLMIYYIKVLGRQEKGRNLLVYKYKYKYKELSMTDWLAG